MVYSICFVCLGNICRSPLAEGVACQLAAERGLDLEIASAGTGGWHVGNPPDSRMQQTAQRHGLEIGAQRAAQVCAADGERFDLFVAMDRDNERALRALFGQEQNIVRLLEFHPGPEADVPDPYYGGDQGFETVYELVSKAVDAMLDQLEQGTLVSKQQRS